ncbi:ABC transporter substrate-binding protein [Sanguibacter sp. Z1732]
MERMAAEFEDAHPDVDITIETFAWPEFYTMWTTGLATGQVPDLSTALPNHVVEMIGAEALVPLDDVIEEIGHERFSEAALTEGSKDGHAYAIPIYSHAQVMWYRTDLLEDAGIAVPETWEELAHAAAALTEDGTYGLSVPLGANDMMGSRFLNFYVQSAGERLLADDGRANLTSEAALEGIDYWVEAYRSTSPEGSLNYDVLDQATLFYQGRTAFDFNSGFHISGVEGASPDLLGDIAAAPLPRMAAGEPHYGGETSNIPMVVWEASDVQEEAKAFLRFLYNDEDYIEFLHSVPGGMLPAMSDISDSPEYQDNDVIEEFSESVAVIEEAVPLGTAIGMEQGPALQAGILTSQGVVERMFHSVILDGTDTREAAEAAERELNELFEAAGAEIG